MMQSFKSSTETDIKLGYQSDKAGDTYIPHAVKTTVHTVTAIKHDLSSNGLSTHIFRGRAMGSIAFYSHVYWDAADKILPFQVEK